MSIHQSETRESSRRFLYVVSEGFPPTVFDSQVLDHLRAMESQGICFDLVVFERLMGILPNWKRDIRQLKEVRSQINGQVYFQLLVTTFLGWDFWVPQWQLYWILKKYGRTTQKVIHARTQTSAALALGLKKWIPKMKVIFDMRGDSPAEYLLSVEKAGADPLASLVQRKFAKLKNIERQAVKGSDAIICVSGAMRERVLKEYGVASEKIRVVPTAASARKFNWDPAERAIVRRELGVEDEFVLIYTGSLRAYQLLEGLVDFFRKLLASRSNLHLLLITPQKTEAEQSLHIALPHGTYSVRSASHIEMFRWLNAADAGLLLRESNAVNQVAAPTKFAEYLMCGLPVVMTAGIGDYSELATKENAGIVLRGNEWHRELNERWGELESLVDQNSREHIARFGKQQFTHERFTGLFTTLYLGL